MAQVSKWSERNVDTNSLVSVSKDAEPGRTHFLQEVVASFTLGGDTEEVIVTMNAVELFRAAVDTGSSVRWTFDDLSSGNPNEDLTVTLDAGGPLNIGTLNIRGFTS